MGAGDLDRPVVVLVGDQDVPVCQQLGAVGVVELVESSAALAGLAVLPDDLVALIDLDHALVDLVGNQDVPARQEGRLDRGVELIEAGAGYPGTAVLPD